MAELTPRQRRFVEEYLVDWNGAAAAVRAGYSEKGAKQQAYRLLRLPHVRAAIDAALVERQRLVRDKAVAVLEQLAHDALLDPRSLVGRKLQDLDLADARALREVTITGGKANPRVVVKWTDPLRAREQFLRAVGHFAADRLELSGPGGGPVQVGDVGDLESLDNDELLGVLDDRLKG